MPASSPSFSLHRLALQAEGPILARTVSASEPYFEVNIASKQAEAAQRAHLPAHRYAAHATIPDKAAGGASNCAGDTYFGEREDGSPHGLGVKEWADGNRYSGEFRRSKEDGLGVFDFVDGSSFAGEFSQSVFHGVGVFKSKTGRLYCGEFHHGKEEDQLMH